jgi:pimeloyl-ACP methyl ester carboxylesterase
MAAMEGKMSSEITDFRIDVADADLDDLRERLRRTRWPERETVSDWSQGIPLAYTQEVCRYWAEEYDWRKREAELNRFPQFRTTIDGLGIHFIHARSPHAGAAPLVLTHGWPGSVVEFHKVIEPFTHPDDPGDAFHVVCPSLPGYGFSEKPTEPGWNIARIARAWIELMARLGYDRYFAQGGDWGSMVTSSIAEQDVARCAGIHLNMVVAGPGSAGRQSLTEAETETLAAMAEHDRWGTGYSKQQSTRPQTLGYGLVDSPAGQAAWILEKFWAWTDCDGHPENVLSRDEMLDNVMLYWIPGTGASSARLYWESLNAISRQPISVPMGASIFPKEIFRPSRRWAERRYSDIRQWHELDKGGHFAALEQPEVLVDEVRSTFRPLR